MREIFLGGFECKIGEHVRHPPQVEALQKLAQFGVSVGLMSRHTFSFMECVDRFQTSKVSLFDAHCTSFSRASQSRVWAWFHLDICLDSVTSPASFSLRVARADRAGGLPLLHGHDA